ncbi:MAG TPA: DNA repair ATPase, partial [Pirellulaceae bacterium]|nr:DNA repair ATPase [Pirellulaceae bacterium]
MAKTARSKPSAPPEGAAAIQLEQSTYEIIRNRLQQAGDNLRGKLDQLNQARRDVFGAIPTTLLSTEQVSTEHNCVARDLVPVGDHFIFGFNVHLGLKTETTISDVFAIYRFADQVFHESDLSLLDDSRFVLEFQQLYKYYSATQFAKFHLAYPNLYMVFQVGKTAADIKVFKWVMVGDRLQYVDNRSEHEVRSPPQHEFLWKRTHRDLHRHGRHPHISVEDIVFVETIGGDLTIKIEDNTDDGQGIYREPVDDPDQTLDDAEIFYALVGNLVLLRIRPFREQQYRYFIYNRKNHHILRQDALEHACVLLPEDHGIVFASGFYTQFGAYRTFDSSGEAFLFEKRIASSNGEDHLFVFHQPATGDYLLLTYNVIEQRMDNPVRCQGYSQFENGHLLVFRAEESARRHHAIQVWQTPFITHSAPVAARTDSFLFKIGNRDVVRAIAECSEIVGLLTHDDTYADLYIDLVRKCQQVLDGYFWLKESAAFEIADVVAQVKQAASAAVSEFDKVQNIRAATQQQFQTTAQATREVMSQAARRRYQSIDEFVESLAQLRLVRGQLISLKDLKYVDVTAVEELEQDVINATDSLATSCVQFLADPSALDDFASQIDNERGRIDQVEAASIGRELDQRLLDIGGKLELLIDIVSNLKIDDASQRTAITDSISTIYASLNHTRAVLRLRLRELLSHEGAAEFAAQLRLLSQAVTSYLDVCDTPQKCDEYLTKMMVQVEELEGKFAEFDEYVVQLAEKRDEVYSAFDAKKLQLVDARNRRAMSLATAAERILGSIQTRVAGLTSLDEINSYFAADLMVDKVRDIVRQLLELDETVKVDELQSRLKTIREDSARQLRDRQDLYVDGQNLIQLGRHQFTVNIQPLDLAFVVQQERMCFHITGTNFIEPVDNEDLTTFRAYWDQAVVSEHHDVYRGEYLAYQMYQLARHSVLPAAHKHGHHVGLPELDSMPFDELVSVVQKFMAPRYSEGYIKGVHDHDAALILRELASLDQRLGWLRFDPGCRALANLAWMWLGADDQRAVYRHRLIIRIDAQRTAQSILSQQIGKTTLIAALQEQIEAFAQLWGQAIGQPANAAEFLYHQLIDQVRPASQIAHALVERFCSLVRPRATEELLGKSFRALPIFQQMQDAYDWLSSIPQPDDSIPSHSDLWEAVSILLETDSPPREALSAATTSNIPGLLGDHARLQQRPYRLEFHEFIARLNKFATLDVPAFERFQEIKSRLLTERREELRLHEFKPRVLTSFVRNRLINEVYLP